MNENFKIELVHPNDYTYCHSVGAMCIINGIHFIRTPSARRFGSVNFPIFREDALASRNHAEESEFFMQGVNLVYKNQNSEREVRLENAYNMY